MGLPNQDLAAKPAATYVGLEVTAGTTPTMVRFFPEKIAFKCLQDNVPVNEERVRGHAHQAPVQGLKSSEGEMTWNLKPDGARLALGTPGASPWGGIPLKLILGAEAFAEGAEVQASSTTTLLNVTASEGANFPLGTWAAAEVSGQLEPFRVKARTSDAITPWPSFSATPNVSAGKVHNSYCYSLTDVNSQSMTIQHAKAIATQGAPYQYTLNLCTGSLKFTIERGKLLQASLAFKGGPWTGPSDQSLVVTAGTDAMSAPVAWRNATVLVQPIATLTRTHFDLHTMSFELMTGMEHTTEQGGTLEGLSGVHRTPQRPVAKITLKHRAVAAASLATFVGYYTAQTALAVVSWVRIGSGLTASFVGFDFATCRISSKPFEYEENGHWYVEYTLDAFEDETTTAGTTDLGNSAFRVFLL